MADYPDHPDDPKDPNQDENFLVLWQNVVIEMMETDFEGIFYEAWLYDLQGYFHEFDIHTKVNEPTLIRLAYDCGVRYAHDLMSRVHLEAIDFSLTHDELDWFIEARDLYGVGLRNHHNESLYKAARIFIAHDIKKAYCCQGFEPSCLLQQAINRELHRWN